MTKTLRKAIMIRSKLKSHFNKTRSAEKLGTAKKDLYSKINPKLVSENKSFWRTTKPYFSDKGD